MFVLLAVSVAPLSFVIARVCVCVRVFFFVRQLTTNPCWSLEIVIAPALSLAFSLYTKTMTFWIGSIAPHPVRTQSLAR
jgi:hypothetical protein